MATDFTRRSALVLPAVGLAVSTFGTKAFAAEPIKVGLVAALSGASSKSGEGISRGLAVAIDEINARGGLLGGRKVELVRRDDESNPATGQTAARELIDKEGCVTLFGGIDSPVSLAIVPIVTTAHVPFVSVWAAATKITRNGTNPNYVFRVSAVDALVDKALIAYAAKTYKAKTVGLMLVNNAWGESNNGGLNEAAAAAGMKIVGTEKFGDKDIDMAPQLQRLREAKPDVLILVGNAAPGAQVVKALQRAAWQVPMISHWGISGGRFPELAGSWADRVHFVQTYSFFGPQNDVGKKVIAAMEAKYPDVKSVADISPPVGVADAYDAMQLTALAIEKAGSTDGAKVREGFLNIGTYHGLIKTYDHPFTEANHDALTENDYVMVRYNGERIEPVSG